MNIDDIKSICMELPFVTEDIKWHNDLVFMVGGKMFCVVGLNQSPTSASFKVTEEEFEEVSTRMYFKPAPYVAKYKWVLIEDISKMRAAQWEHYLQQSHGLVSAKLAPKIKKQLGIDQ
jgi:predicted DNA-binding protein (MmcQ/YjbR family)